MDASLGSGMPHSTPRKARIERWVRVNRRYTRWIKIREAAKVSHSSKRSKTTDQVVPVPSLRQRANR